MKSKLVLAALVCFFLVLVDGTGVGLVVAGAVLFAYAVIATVIATVVNLSEALADRIVK
jgi:hypothetical protein